MQNTVHQRISSELENNKTPRALGQLSNLTDFSSNDYLGMAKQISGENQPQGSTGSRLLTGNFPLAEDTENQIAENFGYESCLIYSSGYMANLGVLSCLPKRNDLILYDQLSHACIKDGARLSMAESQAFRHNDLTDLERRLKKAAGITYVVTESIFSMDGDESPLHEIADLTDRYGASLIVDEAHATGVRGFKGGGCTQENGIQEKILAAVYTFGKGFGGHGAAVASTRQVKEYLVNFSRQFIYTTGLPPAAVQHIREVLPKVTETSRERIALMDNINHFKKIWSMEGPGNLEVISSESAIQAIIYPGNEEVRGLSRELQKKGFDVRPILSPTVAEGRERIRICLHSFNTFEEIEALIRSIAKLV